MWRLLLWRRMWLDWAHGSPIQGAGVGRVWAYNEAFKQTNFHYEQDAGGLNPHNSYLHVLYRFGAIGLVAGFAGGRRLVGMTPASSCARLTQVHSVSGSS